MAMILRWLSVDVLQHPAGHRTIRLPPQGIYNAGQKLFAVLVYMMIPVIMITGLIMTFHLISTTVVAWAVRHALCRGRIGRLRSDDPRVHGRGLSRREARVLLDDHRHGE